MTHRHTKPMARSLRSTRNEQANMFSHVSLHVRRRYVNTSLCVDLMPPCSNTGAAPLGSSLPHAPRDQAPRDQAITRKSAGR